jgi:hypothetical protein
VTITEVGFVSAGGIVLDKPLELPEGSRVIVHIEPAPAGAAGMPVNNAMQSLQSAFPFIGQWADRDGLPDSAEFVREQRAQRQQRPFRQD